MNNVETGKIGENSANEYLINNGYSILTRNHKERFDEIDIIARHPNGVLVFCEVKTLNKYGDFDSGFMPEDNFGGVKLKKMIRAANILLARRPGLIKNGRGWQIDLIAVILENGTVADLRHYENI